MARQDRRGPSDRSLVVGLVLMVALLFALVAIVLLPNPPLCACVGNPHKPTLPPAPTYPPAVITATAAAAAPTRTAAAAATATAASQP